jgi:hypothetical protein
MADKIIKHTIAADSQSVGGHMTILKKSFATAHHADMLKPAPQASQQPALAAAPSQPTPQSTQTTKPK